MAIKTVKFTLNGQEYNLIYDSTAKAYKATVTAPSTTSWNENDDHKDHGTVVVEDTAGNSTTATVSDFATLGLRVLEKVAPSIAVTYPTADAFITNSKPTIKWTVTDTGSGIVSSTIGIKIDSGSIITSGITKSAITNGYSCEYTPSTALSEGSHTITFSVNDNDGNAATAANVSFKIDTVPPTLNVDAPTDGFVTNSETLTVIGVTNDETSSPVTLTVNGEVVTVGADGSFSSTVTLTEGENTITIVATDSSGKTTTVTRTVTLDTVHPTITEITLTPNPVDAGATYIIQVKVSD